MRQSKSHWSIYDTLAILFVLVFFLLFYLFPGSSSSSDAPSADDYSLAVGRFESIDSELHSKYGIYPEDALNIIYAYCDEPDHAGYTFSDVDNAWMLLRDYVNMSREIILPLY